MESAVIIYSLMPFSPATVIAVDGMVAALVVVVVCFLTLDVCTVNVFGRPHSCFLSFFSC